MAKHFFPRLVTRPEQLSNHQPDLIWAYILLLSFSIRWPGFGLVPISILVGISRFPRAYRALSLGKSARLLLLMTISTLLVGALLRFTLTDGLGRPGSFTSSAEIGIWILSFPVLGVSGAYALSLLGMRRGLLLFATSSIVGNFLYYGIEYFRDPQIAWKFVAGYSISISAVLITMSIGTKNVLRTIAVALVLIVISIGLGARSLALIIGIAALLSLPRRQQRVPQTSTSLASPAFWTMIAVATTAWFFTAAMRGGWFGTQFQQEYVRQTAHGRGFLLGGRTESAATMQLLQRQVMGFGLGTRPSPGTVREAVAAVARAGGDVYSPYYSRVVFGPRVDLHSIAADLWFHGGFGGIALATCIGLILILGSLSLSRTPNMVRFACQIVIWQAIWHLGFSPMSSIDSLAAGLMVAMASLAPQVGSSRTESRVLDRPLRPPLSGLG